MMLPLKNKFMTFYAMYPLSLKCLIAMQRVLKKKIWKSTFSKYSLWKQERMPHASVPHALLINNYNKKCLRVLWLILTFLRGRTTTCFNEKCISLLGCQKKFQCVYALTSLGLSAILDKNHWLWWKRYIWGCSYSTLCKTPNLQFFVTFN